MSAEEEKSFYDDAVPGSSRGEPEKKLRKRRAQTKLEGNEKGSKMAKLNEDEEQLSGSHTQPSEKGDEIGEPERKEFLEE